MENSKRVTVHKNGKEIHLNFMLSITPLLYSGEFYTVKISKELAEKYSAQLRKALMDLDRTS